MELKDKLEILIKRNGYKKTDFASAVSKPTERLQTT